MGNGSRSSDPASRVDIVGLGPGDLSGTPETVLELVRDPGRAVIFRTRQHPSATGIAAGRESVSCDDLYEQAGTFEDVYVAIADRVLAAARKGPVVYAVPGSPFVGELAVSLIRDMAIAEGIPCAVHSAESFVDAVLNELRIDPLVDGFQLLNGHQLPDPLTIDKPTVIGHVDIPEVVADVAARLGRVLGEDVEVTVMVDLGTQEARVIRLSPSEIEPALAGPRTSLYVPPVPGGLVGAVHAMRRLRRECPWDREQSHESLIPYLIEETYELAEALARLGHGDEPDWVAYGEVEDELGDLLLQVLFHTNIASEVGAFDIDDVGERLRAKLVRRHPHVFGDVEVSSASEVKSNWDAIKAEERGGDRSLMDGIPTALPGTARAAEVQRQAAKVGFDWTAADQVLDKVREEVEELAAVLDDSDRRAEELGDLLFSIVNLARHLGVDPEIAVRQATHRFEGRFRAMEATGPLAGLTLGELDQRWERAKGPPGPS